MRLVSSSVPGAVERDAAVRALAARAVLTRALCRELEEASGRFADRRPCMALSLLLQWIQTNLPESLQVQAAAGNVYQKEPRPSDGIDAMMVPDDCQALVQEIRDGAKAGDALCMLLTADNSLQAESDADVIRASLAAYWSRHAVAANAPGIY